jgi:hypothetical protein
MDENTLLPNNSIGISDVDPWLTKMPRQKAGLEGSHLWGGATLGLLDHNTPIFNSPNLKRNSRCQIEYNPLMAYIVYFGHKGIEITYRVKGTDHFVHARLWDTDTIQAINKGSPHVPKDQLCACNIASCSAKSLWSAELSSCHVGKDMIT